MRLMPRRYVLASMLCSFGGFLFGLDTGIIGSVTVMNSYTSDFGQQSPTIHGLIVSAILIPAAFSSFFAGKLADRLGRSIDIAIGALIFGIGAAIEAGAVRIAIFAVGRVIEGLGEGLYLGTLIVYICEISPPAQRGPLSSGPQLLVTFGLVVGYFVCYGTTSLESTYGWRIPFIALATLSILFAAAAAILLPTSPRWLIMRGRQSEVNEAWQILGIQPGDGIAPEDDQDSSQAAASGKTPLLDAFSSDVRSRTVIAIFLLWMQQFSGIDGVLYYAPLLFNQAGLKSSEASFLASGVSAIVIFCTTIPATLLADRWGRRASTIYGGLGLSITMILIGSLYAGRTVHSNTGAGRWVVIVAIYIFVAIYSVSWAVGMRTFVAECQPQRTRASATSLGYGSNWAANFLVALTTPILLAKSQFGAYFLFGGCTLMTAAVCFAYMPETKGKSLDDIEDAFRQRRSRSSGISNPLRGLRPRN